MTWPKWLNCAACQRRAKEPGQESRFIGDPFLKGTPKSADTKDVPSTVDTSGFSKLEKILQRASELCSTEQYVYADLSYDRAIELEPLDWRGYYGKCAALQAQGKYFKAFQACQRGCEQLPDNEKMRETKEDAREKYKLSKAAPPPSAVPDGADCPGAVPMPGAPLVSRPWSGAVATQEERDVKKEMMLSIFREQWERIGKAKETMGYNNYQKAQELDLTIKGGHRPMARPDGVALPKDFRKKIGTVDAEHLFRHFNCNCERLLLCIHGEIFDVSDRPDKYGPTAPYYYFAGRDITWGLVSGNDSETSVNQFFDIFKMEDKEINSKLQCICSWTGFYQVEYGKAVGRLAEFNKEHELPAPPLGSGDDCVVQ